MPILDFKNKKEVKKYKDFVDNHDSASIMQSLEWKTLKENWKQEVVYLKKGKEIIAGMTILIRRIPVININLMYAPKGPVCNIEDIETVKKLIEEARPLADKYKACGLRMDPEVLRNEKIETLYRKNGFKVRNEGFDRADMIQPRYNMILNIKDKTEEELLKQFAEKTRYNIRLSGRKNVTVRYSRDREDLKTFCELQRITGERDGFMIRNDEYFEKMLEIYNKKIMRIYLAEHEGDILSAALAINYGGKMWYMYGASSNEKRNLMPNFAMQWEMIKWGLEEKCNEYDFGGVFHLDKNDGLFKFKSGFCKVEGVSEFIGEIDYVFNKRRYFTFTKMYPLMINTRTLIKKIVKGK